MTIAQEILETPQLASACRIARKLEGAKQPELDDKYMLQALKDVAAKQRIEGSHKLVFGWTNVVLYKCGCGVFTEEEFNTPPKFYQNYKFVAKDLVTYGSATRWNLMWQAEFHCDGLRVLRNGGAEVGRLGKDAFGTVVWEEKSLETEHKNTSDFDQTMQMWMTVPVIPGCEEESWRLRMDTAFSRSGFSEKLARLSGQRNGYQARIDHDAFLSYANMCGGIRVEGLNTSWRLSVTEETACLTKEAGALVLHGNSKCVRKMELRGVEGQPEMMRQCTGHLDSVYVENRWLVIGGERQREETRIQGN